MLEIDEDSPRAPLEVPTEGRDKRVHRLEGKLLPRVDDGEARLGRGAIGIGTQPHQIAIVQATAAMFQCYVVDVNGLDAGGNGRSLVADPSGQIVYQAGQAPEILPIMIDLGLVRQARESGANGLGQVLKSWRDRSADFPVYRESAPSDYLRSLGPLLPMRRRQSPRGQ